MAHRPQVHVHAPRCVSDTLHLCGARDIEELSLRDRRGRYLRTTICRKCGLVWSNPRPPEETVKRYYSHEYRLDYKGRSTPSLRQTARSGLGAVNRYRALNAFLRPDDVICDVGAGGGEFVYMLRRLGFDTRGIEPDEQYAKNAREVLGVPVETGFVQTLSFPPNSFTVMTMYHTLEHVEDPSAILSKLRRWLTPGATAHRRSAERRGYLPCTQSPFSFRPFLQLQWPDPRSDG